LLLNCGKVLAQRKAFASTYISYISMLASDFEALAMLSLLSGYEINRFISSDKLHLAVKLGDAKNLKMYETNVTSRFNLINQKSTRKYFLQRNILLDFIIFI